MNIRSAPGDEGARIKHWTSDVSVEAAEKLTQTYADILGAIINASDLTVAQIDTSLKTDDNQDNKVSQEVPKEQQVQVQEVPVNNQPPATSGVLVTQQSIHPDTYRNIVKDCVHGVIDEMFKNGNLVSYAPNPNQVSEVVGRRLGHLTPTNGAELNPESPETQAQSTTDDETESSSMSRSLRSLWAPLLGITEKEIRNNDSFFVLGGDSILAMELARAARDAGLPLTVADIFGTPVFSEMMELVIIAASKRNYNGNQSGSTTENDSELAEIEQEQTRRFSLIKAANAEAFIQDYICPRIGVFRGGIVDVLPVTDFQAMAVAGSLVKSRWMLNYITFDGQGFLDLRRIRNSAIKLVQHFDILRTVFVPCGNRFLQVVLRNLRPQIHVCDTDEDFDAYTERLRSQSSSGTMRLGEPYVQFTILRKPSGNAHRIIMRLSHAQYDGVCLPKMIEVFKAGYEGRKSLPSTPFSNYVREAANHEHYDYWQGLLRGSSMTSIVRRDQPEYSTSNMSTTVLKKTIKLPALASKNITTATVLKAAWSLTLSHLLDRTDIVFGNLISGRNVGIADVESIVGPCLNIIPVRIKLDPKMSALDLLRKVQSQQVASMPYESLGFREVVRQCTEWPEWTYFSSIVQHQNLAQDVELRLDRTKYKVGYKGAQDTLSDMTVVSTPKDKESVEVALDFIENGPVPKEFAQKALDTLCSIAQKLAASPGAAIPYQSTTTTDVRQQQPMGIEPAQQAASPQQDTTALQGLTKDEMFAIASTLTRAWRIVLPTERTPHNTQPSHNERKNTSAIRLETCFHDLGGDLISLASLQQFLAGEGYEVRLDDLMERPTLGAMVLLLAGLKQAENKTKVEEPQQQSVTEGAQEAPNEAAQQAQKTRRSSILTKPLSKSMGIMKKLASRKAR